MGSLSFKRYVNINSGVIGAGGTKQRELIGRLFTSSPRMDADEILEFDSLPDIGKRFGSDSQEYKRAEFYLGWVSPLITKASKISFARYTPTETPARIFGGAASSITALQNLGTSASLTITIGDTVYYVQSIDFQTDVETYADVASSLQSAIRKSSDDNVVKDSTVTFDSSSRSFTFEAGLNGNADVSVTNSTTAQALGWTDSAGALFLAGHVQLSPVDAILLADSLSNNYASVAFVDNLTIDSHVQVAATLQGIDNVTYMYCVPCKRSNYKEWSARLENSPGVAIGLLDDDQNGIDNFIEMIPMIQMAATDYSRRKATSTYMYREFDVPVTVSDNTEANALDKARVNYYGRTQEAGREFAFYQKGYLCGPNTAPLDQSIYANEIWLKSLARVQFMDLLRAMPELPANESGRTYGLSALQGIVDQAVDNGVISIGKALNITQRAAVTQQSGDINAWRQIQNIGYWMNVVITSFTNDAGVLEYRLKYLLIYSKKDVVRSVEGTHALV